MKEQLLHLSEKITASCTWMCSTSDGYNQMKTEVNHSDVIFIWFSWKK